MDIHKNARLTPHSRAELARRVLVEHQTAKAVASAMAVSEKTFGKWVARFRAEGEAGLQDRSSRPRRLHRPIGPETRERIQELRRQRWTGKQIARETGVSPASVSRVLRSLRLSRMRDLHAPFPS